MVDRKLSVVIPNFNYGHFVGEAIDSALAQTAGGVEVIVVDDGSTDSSRRVIESYGRKITSVFQPNRGHREACNEGFRFANGDVVVFLDSDDVLDADFAARVLPLFSPGVSKVQVRMRQMDAHGELTGSLIPRDFRQVDADTISLWHRRTSAYPTPPGSGNAYSSAFLNDVMPAGPDSDAFLDSYLLPLAPMLGRVVAVSDTLVGYRRHDTNDSNLLDRPGRFAREVKRSVSRWETAHQYLGKSPPPTAPLRRSRELLQFRIAAWRLDRREVTGLRDNVGQLVFDILRSPLHPGPESNRKRFFIMAWCLLTLVSPPRVLRILLRARYK